MPNPFLNLNSSISNNSVKHKYIVQLSKTFLFQAFQFSQTVLIKTIQFNISIVFVYPELNIKTVQFQAIQFSISMQFSCIWLRDSILSSSATTPSQSGPWSDGSEGVLRILQSSSITGISPPDCLVSFPGHLLGVLLLCRGAVGVFYSSSRLGNTQD